MPALDEGLKQEYKQLFGTCVVREERKAEIKVIADRIIADKERYKAVERATQVPWFVVAIIHSLEASGNFNKHLHNGDPLAARTVNVPRNRPPGNPPFSWEHSAVDALEFDGITRWLDWSIAGICFTFEKFNGFGYRLKNINSPYLWSFSNHFTRGKFVSDGVFDPNATSSQCGAVVLLKVLQERNNLSLDDEADILITSPEGRVTWTEFFRKVDGEKVFPVIAAMAGSELIEVVEVETRSTQQMIDALGKYPSAKTFLVAPQSKPVPAPLAPAAVPIPVPSTPLPVLTRILRWGSKGDDVEVLQAALQRLGFLADAPDGDFGDDTERAVRAFQTKFGLQVDGEVGPLTWEKLGGTSEAGANFEPDDPPFLKLAAFAAVEAGKKLEWNGPASEAEKYLQPLRERMRALGHIGSQPVFYNWCAAFVTFCCRKVEIEIPDQPPGFFATMALVESWQFWAKSEGFWIPPGQSAPRRGDIVTFDWMGVNGAFNHIGVVRGYQGGTTLETAEGNAGNLNRAGNFTRNLSMVSGIIRIR